MRVGTRGPGGHHLPVFGLAGARPGGESHLQPSGRSWGRAGTRRRPTPRLRTQDRMATARQREVARCSVLSSTCPTFPSARGQESGLLFPKGQTRRESPHRPAARKGRCKRGCEPEKRSDRGTPTPTRVAPRHCAPAPGWAAESVARGGCSQASAR